MNPLIYVTDWIKAVVLTLGVTLTSLFQPYQNFDRKPDIIQPITLEQKAVLFEEDLLKNHLTSEDVFLYELPQNLGDQCIWNGIHVAYRAIRYGVTKDESDLVLLKRFVKSLELLQTHPETGETMLLRGRVPLAEYNGTHGGYRQIHQNDVLIWQEDASGDSFVGHVYGLAMAHKYGDEEVRRKVSWLAISLYHTVLKNKFHLKNADGSKTKFSSIGPSFGSSPARVVGLLLLAKLLEVQTCDLQTWALAAKTEYHRLAITQNQIHVAANSFVMGLTVMKYPNMNLVKIGIHGLLELEENPRYRKKYIKALRRGWRVLKVNPDPILAFLLYKFHKKSVKDYHIENSKTILHEFSTDHKIAYGVNLTDDTSIPHVKWGKRSRPYKAIQPYPVWKQAAKDYYWQRDPHDLFDHGTCIVNCKKFSGLDFLMSYYLGKSCGALN